VYISDFKEDYEFGRDSETELREELEQIGPVREVMFYPSTSPPHVMYSG
jgi:hypothetical protein